MSAPKVIPWKFGIENHFLPIFPPCKAIICQSGAMFCPWLRTLSSLVASSPVFNGWALAAFTWILRLQISLPARRAQLGMFLNLGRFIRVTIFQYWKRVCKWAQYICHEILVDDHPFWPFSTFCGLVNEISKLECHFLAFDKLFYGPSSIWRYRWIL